MTIREAVTVTLFGAIGTLIGIVMLSYSLTGLVIAIPSAWVTAMGIRGIVSRVRVLGVIRHREGSA